MSDNMAMFIWLIGWLVCSLGGIVAYGRGGRYVDREMGLIITFVMICWWLVIPVLSVTWIGNGINRALKRRRDRGRPRGRLC